MESGIWRPQLCWKASNEMVTFAFSGCQFVTLRIINSARLHSNFEEMRPRFELSWFASFYFNVFSIEPHMEMLDGQLITDSSKFVLKISCDRLETRHDVNSTLRMSRETCNAFNMTFWIKRQIEKANSTIRFDGTPHGMRVWCAGESFTRAQAIVIVYMRAPRIIHRKHFSNWQSRWKNNNDDEDEKAQAEHRKTFTQKTECSLLIAQFQFNHIVRFSI